MDALLHSTAERAIRYLSELDDRSVAPPKAALSRLAELGGALPDEPSDPADVIAFLDQFGSPATVASAAPLRLRAYWIALRPGSSFVPEIIAASVSRT